MVDDTNSIAVIRERSEVDKGAFFFWGEDCKTLSKNRYKMLLFYIEHIYSLLLPFISALFSYASVPKNRNIHVVFGVI